MENKIVKIFCLAFALLTVLALADIIFVPKGFFTQARVEGSSVKSFVIETNGEHDLNITLPPEALATKITLDKGEDESTYIVTVPGFNENDFYDFPIEGHCDGIKSIKYAQRGRDGIFEIITENYAVIDGDITSDNVLYLDVLQLHDVYDHVIVVDAGHGGSDTGAVIGDVSEKDLDLAVAMRLKSLLDKDESIKVFYTREDDIDFGMRERVELVEETGADLLLSIHMGATASGRMSTINGARALYRVTDKTGKSKQFAQLCINKLITATGCGSKGVVAGDDIYTVGNVKVPVALVECGFLTNEEEQKKLLTEEYQERCANALYEAIEQTLVSMSPKSAASK
ncbi:MAG: N-acetylmuramoyl-L-alanine amidase [Lachnospiraceae bacterium]|nr:N-acetylmuramoyl-L-alanine amidase [Lachnospiraceae bacterium]